MVGVESKRAFQYWMGVHVFGNDLAATTRICHSSAWTKLSSTKLSSLVHFLVLLVCLPYLLLVHVGTVGGVPLRGVEKEGQEHDQYASSFRSMHLGVTKVPMMHRNR